MLHRLYLVIYVPSKFKNFIEYFIEIYKNNTLPIVDFYKKKNILKTINGMKSIESVNKEILKIIS